MKSFFYALGVVFSLQFSLIGSALASDGTTPNGFLATPVKPRVVLMTSIDESTFHGPFFLHWGYFQHYIDGLETTFRGHFKKSGYDVVVIREANREQVFDALHDPATVGFFWLSHSVVLNGSSPVKGIEFVPRIIDSLGSDVKNLFTSFHPNLKWVSIIACDSSQIVAEEAKAIDAAKDNTKGVYFSELTDARQGLAKALEKSDAVLGSPAAKEGFAGECPQLEGRPVLIERTIAVPSLLLSRVFYPAVTVQYQGKAIAAFPQYEEKRNTMKYEFKQTALVFLEMADALKSSEELDLTFTTGLNAASVSPNLDFGKFEVSAFWSGAKWKAFASPVTGKPFGVTQNLFMYEGPLTPNSKLKSFRPYECANVAPARE